MAPVKRYSVTTPLPAGPSPVSASTSLEGIVERITYVNEETQYVVAHLDVP